MRVQPIFTAAFCLFFTCCLSVSAHNVRAACADGEACLVSEIVAPDAAHVGDVVDIILKYTLPANASLVHPVTVHGLEENKVLSVKDGKGRIRIRCLVESTGQWKTGRLSLDWMDSSGTVHGVSAPAISLPVKSYFAKNREPELQDIKDIMPSVPLWRRLLPWFAATGLMLFAASVFFYFFRSFGNKKAMEPFFDPADEAMRAIEELNALGLVAKGQRKEFCFRLSEIIRRYIERIRGIAASEMTTDELIEGLSDSRDRAMLPVFRTMDQVKFANAIPSETVMEQLIAEITAYIRETSQEREQDIMEAEQ